MKKENINEKQKQVEKNLIEDSKIQVEKLFEKYNTSDAGISIVDIDEKLEEYGPNTIEIKNENTIWHRIKEAFINPFNVVLIIVAIITLFTDVILSKSQDYATFILILSIVLISAIISFREQTKYTKVGVLGFKDKLCDLDQVLLYLGLLICKMGITMPMACCLISI